MNTKEYNGWKNYETWNVSLWINNQESLYRLSLTCKDYDEFIETVGSTGTADGVDWKDPKVDREEINQMMRENHE